MMMALLLSLLPLASATPGAVATLSARHAPPCAALADVPTADLVDVVDTVAMPPWVAPRAAACVADRLGQDPLALTAVTRWIDQPDTLGLALVVADHLDAAPIDAAVTVAHHLADTAANDPRAASMIAPHLRAATRPEIRALTP